MCIIGDRRFPAQRSSTQIFNTPANFPVHVASCSLLSSFHCSVVVADVSRSICQRNSWRPLQITRPMLDAVVAEHDIDSSFWELPSCFYQRGDHFEEVLCVPYTLVRTASVIGRYLCPWLGGSNIQTFDLLVDQKYPSRSDTLSTKKVRVNGQLDKLGSTINSILQRPKAYSCSSIQHPDPAPTMR